MKKLIDFKFLCLLIAIMLACDDSLVQQGDSKQTMRSRDDQNALPQKADELLEGEQSYLIRLLAKDAQGFPFMESDAWSQLNQSLTQQMSISQDIDLNTKEMLSHGKIKVNIAEGGGQFLRRDDLQFTEDIKPFRFLGEQGFGLFPFLIRGNQRIQITRAFESENAALSALSLTLDQLPFTSERALALTEGTLVEIPIEAMLSINATQHWFSKVFDRQEELKAFLSFSALTQLKASAQGLLLMKGLFKLQILKINRDWIRVRVLVDQQKEASIQGTLGIQQNMRAVFIPATRLEKLKNAYLQQSTLVQKPKQWFKTIDQRMDELKYHLSQGSQLLAELTAQENDQYQSFIDMIGDRKDEIIEIIDQGKITLEEINRLLDEQSTRVFGKIDQQIKTTIQQLDAYTKKNLDFNLAIELNGKITQELLYLSDFNVNLKTENGSHLYESLVMGSFWQGINPIQFFGEDSVQKIDLSLWEEASKHSSDIILNQSLATFTQSTSSQISIGTPIISSRLSEKKIKKKIEGTTANQEITYEYEYWGKEREIKGIFFDEGEGVSCGVMTQSSIKQTGNQDAGNQEAGNQDAFEHFYWMTWDRKWSDLELEPLSRSLEEVIQLLGPLSNHFKIPQLYYENIPGNSQAELQIIFNQSLLNEIFSLDEVTLWQILASVAQSFNNQFGIPYLTAWQAPNLSAESAIACDVIAQHWGLKYCHVFDEDFIQPLRLAKEQGKVQDFTFQAQVLKKFYSQTLLSNWTASKLVTRFLSTATVALGKEDDMSFTFKYNHPKMPHSITVDQIGSSHDAFKLLKMLQ